MKKKRDFRCTLLLMVVLAGWTLFHYSARGPMYQGRHIADWVEDALKDEDEASSAAREKVAEIGAPAVPFLAKFGLHDSSHIFNPLEYTSVAIFYNHYPRIGRLGMKVGILKLENCVSRHERARLLLGRLGTNAQTAIPGVIDCLEHCPNQHFVNELEMLETLGEICGTNPAAIAYLTRRAQAKDSLSLRAAAQVYYATGQTNLLVETCNRLAQSDPNQLLGQEIFWLRGDDELNQHLIPLLEKLYRDPKLETRLKESVMFELESRSAVGADAIARLTARETNQPVRFQESAE